MRLAFHLAWLHFSPQVSLCTKRGEESAFRVQSLGFEFRVRDDDLGVGEVELAVQDIVDPT